MRASRWHSGGAGQGGHLAGGRVGRRPVQLWDGVAMRAVHLAGRIDASTASEVRITLHSAALEGDGLLVLDLGDVTQLDVVGLGVLVGLCDRAHRMGRQVAVAHVPPRIAFTLRVTGLNRVLPTAA